MLVSLKNNSWQRPTLPAGYPTSTISAEGLNCRVRDGNGWFPLAFITRKLINFSNISMACAFLTRPRGNGLGFCHPGASA